MKRYSNVIANPPPTQPIITRPEMVKNNAGGYVFKISGKEQLERFLLLGSCDSTFYVESEQLTIDNAKTIIDFIKTNGHDTVDIVIDYVVNERAPRIDPAIFVLALCCAMGDPVTKSVAYRAIATVCKTSTHLFKFLGNVKDLRGWSSGLRKGVANWYKSKTVDQLAYQITKYRQREGYSHRDALLLSHTKATTSEMNDLFKYAAGKSTEAECSHELVKRFGLAKTAKDAELLKLVDQGLSWEMIPTSELNNPTVLTGLLNYMPIHALIRNLSRFAWTGLTNNYGSVTETIVSRLKEGKEHPIMVINAILAYRRGRSDHSDKTWVPNKSIILALNDMYVSNVASLTPSNKKILVACDTSGSMQQQYVNGMAMSPGQVAQVLAVTMLKYEPNCKMINFDTDVRPPSYDKDSKIGDVVNARINGGGTNCAAPVKNALENKDFYDAIIILTDNETWAGNSHQINVVKEYRNRINKNCKIIEVAMVANPSSCLPADDMNSIRVVGFDSKVIDLISEVIK